MMEKEKGIGMNMIGRSRRAGTKSQPLVEL